MNELIVFVSNSIASGVVGSVAYDGIKEIFGDSFNRLTSLLSTNENKKFQETLEILLENKYLKKQVEALRNDVKINKSFIKNKNTKMILDIAENSKINESFINNDNSSIVIK